MSLRRFLRNWSIGSAAIVAASIAAQTVAGPVVAQDAGPAIGGAGTDTALPSTDSAVTVSGRGRFQDLAITVNQTANLTNQAVSITWTGAEPTTSANGSPFDGNFLQIMQCWGDPVLDEGDPNDPADDSVGPPPEQCEFGAVSGKYGGANLAGAPAAMATTRIVGFAAWPNYFDPSIGFHEADTGEVWRPFRPVRGAVVNDPVDETAVPTSARQYWLNPFFDLYTTNEIVGAATKGDGTGAELFQVETGVQSTGLGCGQRVQPVQGGEPKQPVCWIVVVPRGAPAEENVGTPYEDGGAGVVTSPLAPASWANRIAIPISFNSVDAACDIGADQRRISGNELPALAVTSWQPVLCSDGAHPPYSYVPVGDPTARQQLFGGANAPGLVAVSRPLAPTQIPPEQGVVYAPLTLSGITIGFNLERVPNANPSVAPPEEAALTGVRVAEINLTPRLVAKLLTQSYRASIPSAPPPEYEWIAGNPPDLTRDPDFIRFNPEFEMLQMGNRRSIGGLSLPVGNSDAALAVWEWILADPEARAWLDGAPDEDGMRVNPYYSTNPAVNPTGAAFGDPIPISFPKTDPYCFDAPATATNLEPPLLCGTDWKPYARGFADAARVARRADDGARIVQNPAPTSTSDAWIRDDPQWIGSRAMLSLTDTASAARFGLQTARLSRAGDDGAEREFVAPDADAMVAAVSAMPASDVVGYVRVPDPAHAPAGAYPLTTLTYAAAAPLTLDPEARADYADFIRFATGAGQTAGFEPGQLPPGYAPLPAEFQALAAAVADEVQYAREIAEFADPLAPPTTPAAAPAPATTTQAPAAARPGAGPAPTPGTPAPDSPDTTPTGGGSAGTGSGAGRPVPSVTTITTTTTIAPSASSLPTTVPVPPSSLPPVGDEPAPDAETPAALTPLMSIGQSRYAVPGLGVVGLGSALGALEISKRPRRALGGVAGGPSGEEG